MVSLLASCGGSCARNAIAADRVTARIGVLMKKTRTLRRFMFSLQRYAARPPICICRASQTSKRNLQWAENAGTWRRLSLADGHGVTELSAVTASCQLNP